MLLEPIPTTRYNICCLGYPNYIERYNIVIILLSSERLWYYGSHVSCTWLLGSDYCPNVYCWTYVHPSSSILCSNPHICYSWLSKIYGKNIHVFIRELYVHCFLRHGSLRDIFLRIKMDPIGVFFEFYIEWEASKRRTRKGSSLASLLY
jgi:hypothetical protein